ncbi:hypothetical protein ACIPCA_12635 [Flavobacterium covae]|uniref:Lipoprotein n=1 Tax=Flavobacterium davisii TaxID=2906077 RepID=A0A246GF16_9FLAO|nr:hypothetical protein [Flavobacterium davisii]OWP82692.1 hypothetical protein BWK59_14515 [Flavobacterium davisii]QYS89146.1 hypothetical protein JJC05_01600 [Flavobacterium davisii]
MKKISLILISIVVISCGGRNHENITIIQDFCIKPQDELVKLYGKPEDSINLKGFKQFGWNLENFKITKNEDDKYKNIIFENIELDGLSLSEETGFTGCLTNYEGKGVTTLKLIKGDALNVHYDENTDYLKISIRK